MNRAKVSHLRDPVLLIFKKQLLMMSKGKRYKRTLIYQDNGCVKFRKVVKFDAIEFCKKINCDFKFSKRSFEFLGIYI